MFIYLHGFNSSGASAKGHYFSEALRPETVSRPSYPPDPHAAIRHLSGVIADHLQDNPVLIGSSIGGFYAQYLAQRWRLATILINPALAPAQTLNPYQGWQKNYYTGERYYFGAAQLSALSAYTLSAPCRTPVPSLILLDSGDEVIDYRVAAMRYAKCAEVIVFPGGNHQFTHLEAAARAIRKFMHNMRSKPQI